MGLLVSTLTANSDTVLRNLSLVKTENYYFFTSTNSAGCITRNCSVSSAFLTLTKIYSEYKEVSIDEQLRSVKNKLYQGRTACRSFEPCPTFIFNCVNTETEWLGRTVCTAVFLKAIFGKWWAVLKYNCFHGHALMVVSNWVVADLKVCLQRALPKSSMYICIHTYILTRYVWINHSR